MQPSIEYILLVIAVLILVSILANKVSGRLGVPALLIFLLVGMLAGSEGPGGIYFNDPWIAQAVGVIALTYILFSGGLDTRWSEVRPVLPQAAVLSTHGRPRDCRFRSLAARRIPSGSRRIINRCGSSLFYFTDKEGEP